MFKPAQCMGRVVDMQAFYVGPLVPLIRRDMRTPTGANVTNLTNWTIEMKMPQGLHDLTLPIHCSGWDQWIIGRVRVPWLYPDFRIIIQIWSRSTILNNIWASRSTDRIFAKIVNIIIPWHGTVDEIPH